MHCDNITNVPVVKRAEIRCRPPTQIRGTGEELWRAEFAHQRAEMLKSSIQINPCLILGNDKFQRTAVVRRDRRGKFAVMIVGESVSGDTSLFQVAYAPDSFGARL
jgi:hypothetical protein